MGASHYKFFSFDVLLSSFFFFCFHDNLYSVVFIVVMLLPSFSTSISSFYLQSFYKAIPILQLVVIRLFRALNLVISSSIDESPQKNNIFLSTTKKKVNEFILISFKMFFIFIEIFICCFFQNGLDKDEFVALHIGAYPNIKFNIVFL